MSRLSRTNQLAAIRSTNVYGCSRPITSQLISTNQCVAAIILLRSTNQFTSTIGHITVAIDQSSVCSGPSNQFTSVHLPIVIDQSSNCCVEVWRLASTGLHWTRTCKHQTVNVTYATEIWNFENFAGIYSSKFEFSCMQNHIRIYVSDRLT